MTTKLVSGLLIVPAIFAGLLLTADYALVDVREGGPDGMRLIVPVPLSLARLALHFAPADAKYVRVPEIAEYLPHAARIVDALREAQDGLLVSVEQAGETVRIEKVGESLEIHVADGSDVVDAVVPLDAALGVLEAYDGEGFDTRDVLRAVGRARGRLVHARDADAEVKVWIW